MKTFWIRTASATVYAALFLGCIYSGAWVGQLWGTVILTAFALFVACGCTIEYYRMAAMQNAHPLRIVGYLYVVATVVLTVLLSSCTGCSVVRWVVGAGVLLAAPVALTVRLCRYSEHPFSDVAYTLLPSLYVALPLGLMPWLHYQHNVLVMCIIMVWVNDSFAYMGGSLLGRHKLWPRHSPGKTWEGSAIGLLFTVGTGLWIGPLFHTSLVWYDWPVLAVVCSVVGTLGDLAESMLKRSVGLKDSGRIMPGHGGFLDRFDSLLFILPVAAAYMLFT